MREGKEEKGGREERKGKERRKKGREEGRIKEKRIKEKPGRPARRFQWVKLLTAKSDYLSSTLEFSQWKERLPTSCPMITTLPSTYSTK